jgi:hypothetical protein
MRQRLFPNSLPRLALRAVLCAVIGGAFSLATAQTENILHRFNPNSSTDGNDPGSGLVADKAGNLYGTTRQGGGTADCGIAYELSPPGAGGTAWTEMILHDFAGGTDGCLPIGALAMDKNGNLYGTTAGGGDENSDGTAFELTPPSEAGGAWTYAVISSFDNGIVAQIPTAQLVIDASGNLYGTSNGGINSYPDCGGSCGNIFELQPPSVAGGAWTGASIYDFLGGTSDGFGPSGLVLGPDGVIYGTTGEGGPEDYGTFFRLAPPTAPGGAWTERVVYLFTSANAVPFGNLVAGATGTYFGTSEGPYPLGAVYELFPPADGKGWTESILYTFTGGSDGSSPTGVVSDRFGNLYGVNIYGGTSNNGNCLTGGCGAAYELSPPTEVGGAWTETTLHDFVGGYDGGNPVGPVVLVKGLVFGATSYGGNPKYGLGGTVFRIMP